MKPNAFLAATVLSLSLLTGCANPHPEGKPLPKLDFAHLQYHPVQVGLVDVVNSYAQNKATADAARMYVSPPDEVFTNYLKARYKPQGGQGRLLFDIKEASVYVFHEESDVGVARWVDMAGFEEYSLTLKLHMRAENIPGFYEKTKDFSARRRVKISEHASIAQREQDQFEAMEIMLQEIDAAIYKTLREEFLLTP